MKVRYVIYVLLTKNVTGSIGCYIYTSNRPQELGSNFRKIRLARRVSTARSHP